MKITICGSTIFIDEMVSVKEKLEGLRHMVDMPPIKVEDGKGNLISVADYHKIRKEADENENWVWERKEWAMKEHFSKVAWADAILVLNYDKNNISGYIGANTLLEMGLALHLNKKIFIFNAVPEISYKEEILGMRPVIINGDLSKISQCN